MPVSLAANQRIVQPLRRWQREAYLRPVRSTEVVRAPRRWSDRYPEAKDVTEMMALEEQLAATLID